MVVIRGDIIKEYLANSCICWGGVHPSPPYKDAIGPKTCLLYTSDAADE